MSDRQYWHGSLARGESCVQPADLEALVAGQGSPTAVEHVQHCAFCRGEMEVLRAFLEDTPSKTETPQVMQIEQSLRASPAWKGAQRKTLRWAFFSRPWGGGLAAAGVVAALAVVYLQQPQAVAPINDDATTDVVRSIQVDGISPIGDLAAPPPLVRWAAVPGAVRYLVSMEEVDGTSIWRQTVSAAELALPQEARGLMTDRKTLRWVVSAVDGQGRTIAVSTPQQFRFVQRSK